MPMTSQPPLDPAEHTRQTREAYDRLAPVWSATTDDGPFNGALERPALRSLVPTPLAGATVLDAACGSGAQCEWLLDQGADVTGVDISPGMVDETRRRCGDRARLFVADLAEPLALAPGSLDGVTCSLALHYLRDWTVPLRSFASALRPGGWVVMSLDHPFGRPRSPYFRTELVGDTWRKADVEVRQHFWRRPLAETIGAFGAAGFAVDAVAEPQPDAETLRRWPDEFDGLVGVPIFIVYRLRKLTG
jgi:SAM-dependent methyltransferase